MHPPIRSILVSILPIVSILLILFRFSATSAQLPPEIRADAYLLQAEQAFRDGDHDRARTVIGKIRVLQDQHDLDLADDFHFRYANAAADVGLSDLALESIVTYLAATGRDGLHYVKALEVMNQARAGSSSRNVPAQLSTDIRAGAYLAEAEQAIRNGDLARAKTAIRNIRSLREQHNPDLADTFHFRYAKAAATVGLPEQALESVVTYLTVSGREGQHYADALELMNWVQREVSCRGWDSEEYFKTATLEEVTAFLDTGIDVKIKDDSGVTPLHRAAKYSGKPDVIKAVLNAGAVVDERDYNEETPLHWAADQNNAAAVKALIGAGANPNVRDNDRQTPLHHAVDDTGNQDVIQDLLNARADVDARDDKERTPLHLAAKFNNPVAITALIDARADLESQDKREKTPLHYAVEDGHPDAIEVLLRAGADRARVKPKWTALHWSVTYNENPAAIKAMLNSGAKLKAKDKEKNRPLHVAAKFNKNADVIRVLINAGADVNAKNSDKWRPLHLAARYNKNPDVVKPLIDAGAGVHARTGYYKNTPLHLAARYNRPDVVKALIDAGADMNARNEDDDETPLHAAARYNGNADVVKALIDAGAGLNARNEHNDETPLHVAAWYNENPDVVTVLIHGGADLDGRTKNGSTPLHLAGFNDNGDVVKVLLGFGADLTARNEEAETPLDYAASGSRPNIVNVLIDAGADPNTRSIYGTTPLHAAAFSSRMNPEVIRALIKAGADPNARSISGGTPLHRAANPWFDYIPTDKNTGVIRALIDAGADPSARNNEGFTPLDLAIEYDNPEVAIVLRNAGARRTQTVMKAEPEPEKGTDWTRVAVGVLGAAAIAHAGRDAPSEVTDQALADWINVMTEEGSAAGTLTGSGASQAQGATAQGNMEQALRNLESVCGETYRSGFGSNDHARFYCMAAFNDHCALKRAANEEARTKLRASKAQNCGVLQVQGLAGKCSYCQ